MSDTTTPTRAPRRIFDFNGQRLADPDPTMTPDQVRKLHANSGYPALTNARIEGPRIESGKEFYTFKSAVGTKG